MSEWEIAGWIGWVLHVTWAYAYVARSALRGLGRDARIASRLFFEIRPFVPACITARYVSYAITDGVENAGWRALFLALDVVVYLIARREKDDDDRWKKRLEAMGDKVSDLGHRLVVVPGGSR